MAHTHLLALRILQVVLVRCGADLVVIVDAFGAGQPRDFGVEMTLPVSGRR